MCDKILKQLHDYRQTRHLGLVKSVIAGDDRGKGKKRFFDSTSRLKKGFIKKTMPR